MDQRTRPSGLAGNVRTAVVWELLSAVLAEAGPDLVVVDAGGGTGGFAVPLAEAGHRVTVVDPSPDALAALERRTAERGLDVAALQGDLSDLPQLVAPGSVDLVLCHSVLEMVDDPEVALRVVADVLKPGGRLSLLVANRDAVVLARALAGRPDEAAHALTDPHGRWGAGDGTARRWTLHAITALVAASGLHVEQVHGVRTVSDLVPSAVLDTEPGAAAALLALERTLSDREPFRELATQLHVLARKG
jgi:SAM-dependent methyltransferase